MGYGRSRLMESTPMLAHFDSLFDLLAAFPDEQSCIDHVRAFRWRDGEFCPLCGGTRIYHFSDRKTFKCGECRQRFSIKVGTIFEDTKLPLRKWFMAIWMITNHPKGIASTTMAKDLKVTQKTAWFVLHRVRHAARTKSFNAPLKGIVEGDETYIGGKEKNKHASKRKHAGTGGTGKDIVFGMIEREGELRTLHVTDMKAKTVQHIIRENVAPASTIMTDEHASFVGLQGEYSHHAVNHSKGEYVRHFVLHTNSIESVWALLKRHIIGIHHWVSSKHLEKYVQEMTWRFNHRGENVTDRMNDLFNGIEGPLKYKALIAK
jgi:transposase-like protein